MVTSALNVQSLSWLPASSSDLYGEVLAGYRKLLWSWFLESEVACAEYYHTSETHPGCKMEADRREVGGEKKKKEKSQVA